MTTASGTTGTDQVRHVEVHDGGRVLVDPELQRPRRERVHGDDPRRLPGQRPAQRERGDVLDCDRRRFAGVYGFNVSTGANTANRDFGLAGEIAGGVAHDGTAFSRMGRRRPDERLDVHDVGTGSTATQPFWPGVLLVRRCRHRPRDPLGPRATSASDGAGSSA